MQLKNTLQEHSTSVHYKKQSSTRCAVLFNHDTTHSDVRVYSVPTLSTGNLCSQFFCLGRVNQRMQSTVFGAGRIILKVVKRLQFLTRVELFFRFTVFPRVVCHVYTF